MNQIRPALLSLITVVETMSAASTDFTTGLEAYWAFDDARLTDSSGNGHILANEGSTMVR